MNSSLRSIILYAVATVLISGSSFASVPLLLQLLGHSEFAVWALIEPLILVAIPLAGLGIQIGVMRLARSGTQDAVDALLPAHLVCSILVATSSGLISAALGIGIYKSALIAATVLFEGTMTFFISLWRGQNRPTLFAIAEGGRAFIVFILLLMTLTLQPTLVQTSEHYLYIRIGVGFISVALSVAITRPRWKYDTRAVKVAISYGLPIVFSSMILATMGTLDRYALAFGHVSDLQISAYVAHTRVAQIIGVATGPFFTWFGPIAMQRIGDKDRDNQFFQRATYWLTTALLVIATGIVISAPSIWPLAFQNLAYDDILFSLLVVGTVIFAVGAPTSVGTLRAGRTKHALFITLGALFIGCASSLLLVQFWGAHGVAIGRLAGYAAYVIALAAHTWHYERISYQWVVLLVPALAGGLAGFFFAQWDVGALQALAVGTLAAIGVAGLGFLAAKGRGGLL